MLILRKENSHLEHEPILDLHIEHESWFNFGNEARQAGENCFVQYLYQLALRDAPLRFRECTYPDPSGAPF